MSKFNVGDKVRYIGEEHTEFPRFYPAVGTVGVVDRIDSDGCCWVQWPKGTTSKSDYYCCCDSDIELVENVDMTNEEIWEMLESKMRKNGLTSIASISHFSASDYLNGLAHCEFIPTYAEDDVHNAIALAYKVGYLRSQKGRPFKIGEKKKKDGHWEPVDPNNLPKEGTRVRYSRENVDWTNSAYVEIGDTGMVYFWEGFFGFNLDVSKGMDWICILTQADCLDMWVEDDE